MEAYANNNEPTRLSAPTVEDVLDSSRHTPLQPAGNRCPIELLNVIMGRVSFDSKLACSLVCRTWRMAAYPLIFVNVKLSDVPGIFGRRDTDATEELNPRIASLRSSLIHSAPFIVPWTKKVRIEIGRLEIDFVAFVLSLFPNLHTLVLITDYLPSPSPNASFPRRIYSLPRVEINFGGWGWASSLSSFESLLHLFTSIDHVHITFLSLAPADSSATIDDARTPVRSVHLPVGMDSLTCNQFVPLLDPATLTSVNDHTIGRYFLAALSKHGQFTNVENMPTDLGKKEPAYSRFTKSSIREAGMSHSAHGGIACMRRCTMCEKKGKRQCKDDFGHHLSPGGEMLARLSGRRNSIRNASILTAFGPAD